MVRGLVSTAAADAEFYLHGAHLTGWTPRGQRPVLFTSSRSLFVPGKAIRGGVPIVFPWFGPRGEGKSGPLHGFARIAEWSVESAGLRGDGELAIAFMLGPNAATRELGYEGFEARFSVAIGARLEMEFAVHNLGGSPLTYEAALHTYLAIGDIHRVSVAGLEGSTYIDKTDGFQRKVLGNDPIRIAKETDHVHVNTRTTCVIDDPVWNRRIAIDKSGSGTTVVWNPWIEKTKSLSDMAPDDWQGMLCVETANALEDAVHLAPGEAHTMTASVRVEPRR